MVVRVTAFESIHDANRASEVGVDVVNDLAEDEGNDEAVNSDSIHLNNLNAIMLLDNNSHYPKNSFEY
jgi:hypothetical protein